MLSYLCDLVKLAEEFVQRVDQFTRRAIAGQPGEAHDVGIQDAAEEGPVIMKPSCRRKDSGQTWLKMVHSNVETTFLKNVCILIHLIDLVPLVMSMTFESFPSSRMESVPVTAGAPTFLWMSGLLLRGVCPLY